MNTNKRKNKKNKPKAFIPKQLKINNEHVMSNSVVVRKDGQQSDLIRGEPQVKFVDVQYAVSATSVGTILAGICNIPQGITVNQRTGDTVFWKKLFINYSLATQNADVFNTTRILIFQWHPNSALTVPVVTDVLQTANLYAMYDWQFSNQYTILYDVIHYQSGTATNPSSSGLQGYFGQIELKGVKRADYAAGVALGSQQFYILIISDSLIAPFPTFTAITRITYSEE
jgi:hypothetical protein